MSSVPPPPPPSSPSPSGPSPDGHPSGLPSDVRNLGMAAHLSAFLGAWAALAFVGPLVLWLVKRDDHPFIAHHALEALNFNLSILIYAIAAAVLAFTIIGLVIAIPAAIAIGVGWVVLTIVAAVKAANGEGYRYPMTIRFVS
ncbi:MAG: DUF4870 domain-containing protein [Actinobacteria bacterium]|nr:DUF4870 domain-containing protein [Actinomycetota bacterium]